MIADQPAEVRQVLDERVVHPIFDCRITSGQFGVQLHDVYQRDAAHVNCLKQIDDGRFVRTADSDVVNTQNMGAVNGLSDEEFFQAMFAEVNDWLPAARAAGLI